ncbi:MAG TPA: thioredoxin domain-containing protein [Methanothermobacter sp.]|nr:thioredoxin domain-containing protein [Methanothermobacter sp.]
MSHKTSSSARIQNHLQDEKSPYLLQHADNPVDWYPWGDEAFEKAKKEDKPIFLSIGYSTCHWCHVMARESFQDPEIGKIMNETFVSVKVDREERPDIDSVYMAACQMITGTGGWPLTIIMTPDLKPFFAGTYFPKDSGSRGSGLRDIILNVGDLWNNRKDELQKSAEELTFSLQQLSKIKSGPELDEKTLKTAYQSLNENFDDEFGGFGDYQKFPTPHNLLFLLRYWKMTDDMNALNMVEKTLDAMVQGGIYDHLGFGFHRYSVDRQWIQPHFEKMLYDQALLVIVYTEAYQATGNKRYRETAQEVLEYLMRDMRSSLSGFYSAEDADSEGEEGKFYLWTASEIKKILGPEDGELFSHIYNVNSDGNFKEEATGFQTGKNVLYRTKNWEDLSSQLEITSEELWWKMESAREKLFTARQERIHPHKDDKILTDWNGLTIVALAIAGRVYKRKDYIMAASNTLNFILSNLKINDQLMHRWRQKDAAVNANLDDYAYLIWGLLEMYQTTFQAEYLKIAIDFNQKLMDHFWDKKEGGFYFTADFVPQVLVRQKEAYDTALPSGNSVHMLNLERLYSLTGNSEYRKISRVMEKNFSGIINSSPPAFTMFLSAITHKIGPSFNIVVVGDKNLEDTSLMLKNLQEQYLPNCVLIFNSGDENLEKMIKNMEDKIMINNKITAYVCGDGTCYPPVNTLKELLDIVT